MASDPETRTRRWTVDLSGRIDIFAATEEEAFSLARDSCDIAVNGEAGIGVLAPMAAGEFVSRDATLDGLAAALFEAQAEIRRLLVVADALPLEGHQLWPAQRVAMRVSSDPERFIYGDGESLTWVQRRLERSDAALPGEHNTPETAETAGNADAGASGTGEAA